MVTVRIPLALRQHSGGLDEVTVAAGTLAEVLDALARQHPALGRVLLDAGGVRRFVTVYVGDEDARFLAGLDTVVADGVEVSIQSAIAGG